MDTATLKQIFIKELEGYTGASLNDVAYLTTNEAKGIYTIVDFTTVRGKRLCSTVLVARLAGDRVVIELDRHDKLLVDALQARGVPLGILAAVRVNSGWDLSASFVSVIGLAFPNFWLGILMIWLFAVVLKWLPASGYVSLFEDPISGLRHMIMPALALGGGAAAGLMRHVRSSLLEVLRDDYIRTARAKGLHERRVLLRHALKNSLIPVVTVMGLTVGGLMGGSLIVESIFLVPGVGSLLVTAIFHRDFPVIQAGAMILALFVILINLGVDLLYGFLDPRIRYQ